MIRRYNDVICQDTCPHGSAPAPDTCSCADSRSVSPCAVSPLYSGVTSSSSAAHPAKVATYVGLVAIALGTVREL